MSLSSFDRKLAIESGWQQCSIFDSKSCPELYNLLTTQHKIENAFFMVLSHPCSLLNSNLESEPYLEYIICEKIENLDGNATNGKNPRLLHIELRECGGVKFKLEQKNRGFIDKSGIAKHAPLYSNLLIENESLITRWMANRYITTALPDEFENRIKNQKSKLTKAFATDAGRLCKAVYISMNEFIKDLDENENYVFFLVFLLSAKSYEKYVEEEGNSKSIFNDFINRILKIYKSVEGVELEKAIFISEKQLTIGQIESGQLKKWQFDYISLAKGGQIISP